MGSLLRHTPVGKLPLSGQWLCPLLALLYFSGPNYVSTIACIWLFYLPAQFSVHHTHLWFLTPVFQYLHKWPFSGCNLVMILLSPFVCCVPQSEQTGTDQLGWKLLPILCNSAYFYLWLSVLCCVFHAAFFLGLLFESENGGDMFLWNVLWLSLLDLRRQNS
jgi:hypothetical protein